MNRSPKSSGPPGPVDGNIEVYIRRRISHDASRALGGSLLPLPSWAVAKSPLPAAESHALPILGFSSATSVGSNPIPRALAPAAAALLTLVSGSNSILIHDERMADRVIQSDLDHMMAPHHLTRSQTRLPRSCAAASAITNGE